MDIRRAAVHMPAHNSYSEPPPSYKGKRPTIPHQQENTPHQYNRRRQRDDNVNDRYHRQDEHTIRRNGFNFDQNLHQRRLDTPTTG